MTSTCGGGAKPFCHIMPTVMKQQGLTDNPEKGVINVDATRLLDGFAGIGMMKMSTVEYQLIY